jgi:molybdopterin-guanine dinucleotide biosynthesis adapter protein
MRVVGLAGWSGAGKTTLLVKLLAEFARRGLSVSTIKHAHHGFDIDQPGKDSFEHRRAGAREVLVASRRRWALVRELRGEPEPTLAELLAHLGPADLVIVEGFKAERHPKLEVHRAANGKPLLFGTIPNVRAIAADVAVPDALVPVIDLDDVPLVAERMLSIAVPAEKAFLHDGSEPAPPA